ncbi:MAG: carboxymuconolactone decarboxylase family protein [Ignavibacteriales bacterium]|nr:carboxymuconolactone decarboxylase family protein [Ignavibacteriales bacterium]
MQKPPKRYQDFSKKYRDIAKAYEEMGSACHSAGPLDEKTRALVKLAISIGARIEGSTHAHARKAIAAGVKAEELYHVALLAIPTIGFPPAMAAMSWVEDMVKPELPARKRK